MKKKPLNKLISIEEGDMDALAYCYSLQGIVDNKKKEYDKIDLFELDRTGQLRYRSYSNRSICRHARSPSAICGFHAHAVLARNLVTDIQ